MYITILIVHVFVCIVLIAVILLQAGRGGGVAEVFGGGAQGLLGTRASTFLTRATTGCAVVFMLTSLSLAVLSARQGRSLMERVRPPQGDAAPRPSGQPAAPAPAVPATPSAETKTPASTDTTPAPSTP